ncbi:MAG: 4-hydroxy-tetrahydrodipicolinate reductase [Chitinophagaceae bacterium]
MRIALIGYGKMGKAIEEIALEKGYEIVLKISSQNTDELTTENLQRANVAIEFTNPQNAVENIKKCLNAGIPTVSGSTGWLKNYNEIENYCKQKNRTFLYASNFSIGVNLFFELNKFLSKLMSSHEEYIVTIEEIHHTQKKDAPSGTAISLAEQILQNIKTKKTWVNCASDNKNELEIISKRMNEIPGIHKINYNSEFDEIEIIHTAHNRKGFAAGALLAAEFIKNKKGVFTMKDVLQL